MSKTKTTTEDGWGCVPQLKEIAEIMDDNATIIYEIKNCVRDSDLRGIVSELLTAYETCIQLLDTIDVDVEYETEWEDDDDDYYDMRSDVG